MFQMLDKVEFVHGGQKRLGVILQPYDSPVIRTIDRTEYQYRYEYLDLTDVDLVQKVGRVEPKNDSELRQYVIDRITTGEFTKEQLLNLCQSLPYNAIATETEEGYVVCGIEKPNTYTLISEFGKTISNGEMKKYQILEDGNGDAWLKDCETGEMGKITPADIGTLILTKD